MDVKISFICNKNLIQTKLFNFYFILKKISDRYKKSSIYQGWQLNVCLHNIKYSLLGTIMTKTHPTSDMLHSYASGNISEGMELFVKTHLNYCPCCRKKVSEIEELAGSLLKSNEPQKVLTMPAYSNVKEKILEIGNENTIKRASEGKIIKGGKFPQLINNIVGSTSEEINWRFRLPGISDYSISKENGEEISLLKAEPGSKIFQHTHEGSEATLVLCGTMKDDDKILEAGDISIVDQTNTHNPEIVGNETCICLIVMTGKVKFTGRFTRAFNLLN